MVDLRTRIAPVVEAPVIVDIEEEIDERDPQLVKIESLIDRGEHAEAFFLARRALASGEPWASDLLERARTGMGDGL